MYLTMQSERRAVSDPIYCFCSALVHHLDIRRVHLSLAALHN
jgi:hypothetical protein